MILVVDDYLDAAKVLMMLLRHSGYPSEVATGGPGALAYIRAHPPEQPLLVVLDVMMPDMNGIEVLKAIRADAKIAHTAVIFHSAGFDLEHRDEAMTLGALAWFYKGGSGRTDVLDVIKEMCRLYEHSGGAKNASGHGSPT